MSDRAAQHAFIRNVLLTSGGWNRRSRQTLLAWAQSQSLDETVLVGLIEETVKQSRNLVPQDRLDSVVAVQPQATRRSRHWVMFSLSLVGCLLSAVLVGMLVQRLPRNAATPLAPTVTQQASTPSTKEVSRTLPPPPVSFPQPPALGEDGQKPHEAPEQTVIGKRPSGDLTESDLFTFEFMFLRSATNWVDLQEPIREATVEGLAQWIAVSASPAEVERLQGAMHRAMSTISDQPGATLASAFEAMVRAQVSHNEQLSSSAASISAFGISAPTSMNGVLRQWATDQVGPLVQAMSQPDGRNRWIGWMRAVEAMTQQSDRSDCALAAINALLRSTVRLDGQGIAADAMASALKLVPSNPQHEGFGRVRDTMVQWLRDSTIASARLWSLGGVWRSLPDSPDPWLLPGERDTPAARTALAERWNALSDGVKSQPWTPLSQRLMQLRKPSNTDRVAQVVWLADLVALNRQAVALALHTEVEQVEPWMDAESSKAKVDRPQDNAWASLLADTHLERRMAALQSLQTLAPRELGVRDAAALVSKAVSSSNKAERSLAQTVIRQSLLDSAAMQRAFLFEVSESSDPRSASILLGEMLGGELLSDEAQTLRLHAVESLLARQPLVGDGAALQQVARRLAEEMNRWARTMGAAAYDSDAGVVAWLVANRAAAHVASLRLSQLDQNHFTKLSSRMRRLERLAPTGPRAFAAGLSVLCDLRSIGLATQCSNKADALARLAHLASRRRQACADVLQQAAVSLETIASMELLCAGAEAEEPSAISPDPIAIDGSTALSRLPSADTPASRRQLYEIAVLAGDGAMLPALPHRDPADGLVLVHALALADRGQFDRLIKPKQGDPIERVLQQCALAHGMTVLQLIDQLRQGGADVLERSMMSAALHDFGSATMPWLSAMDAGDLGIIPETIEH